MRIRSAFQFTKHGNGERHASTWRLGKSRLSSVVQLLNLFFPHFLSRPESSGVDSSAQKNTRDEHTPNTLAHLFEDPTNLSNSALGVLLMGVGGRG